MSGNKGVSGGINNPAFNDEIEVQDVQYDDDNGEEIVEEEVEEEVTDDEDGSEAPSSAVNVESPAASRVAETPKNTKSPGRVKPSEKVKNMRMKGPEHRDERSGTGLAPNKDPFPSFGEWTPETLSEIEIDFPILSAKHETTNELTRSTKPEARYWKAPIVFRYGSYTSSTIRFDSVHIPYHTGKGYGSSYVYLCLPGFVGDAFAEAGKRRAPTKVGENSLVPDPVRWWKIANNVENAFGIINKDTKKFHSKSLETIFDSTNSGISCSVVLSFKCKAATQEAEALRATTARTISVEVVRGYINDLDVNVQMPVRISREKAKVTPVASSQDIATDNLMKRLSELGL